jgi:hypothetical protein
MSITRMDAMKSGVTVRYLVPSYLAMLTFQVPGFRTAYNAVTRGLV